MMSWRSHWIPAFAGMTEWVEVDVFENSLTFNTLSPRQKPGSRFTADLIAALDCPHRPVPAFRQGA
jgi:hypothetical protein